MIRNVAENTVNEDASMKMMKLITVGSVLIVLFTLASAAWAADPDPILVGLNADMCTSDGESGVAIQRGALIAMEEINAAGGVLGRSLALEVLGHRRNPARGIVNVRTLAEQEDVAAILGGKHTPVILAELETIHEYGIPYLVPWAAGTSIIDNGHDPNFVFRVSVRDEHAGGVLVNHALGRGLQRLGLILEQTGWGRSNERAFLAALEDHGLSPVGVEWYGWGEQVFDQILDRLTADNVDGLLFVGNAPDGVNFVRALALHPVAANLPVISHWGIVGGDFVEPLTEELRTIDLTFLQTFSFFDPPHPDRAERVAQAYFRMVPEARVIGDILAPTGVAHAYDLVHLLARAIAQAGTTDRAAVREALENLEFHPGLVRDYTPPFNAERHDALDRSDYRMARYLDGVVVPVAP